MNKLLALLLLAAYTAAGPAPVPVQPSQDLNCLNLEHDKEFFSCIFVKAIGALDRAARSSNIEIVEGVTFVQDTPAERIGKSLKINEKAIMNELPEDMSDRTIKLFNMLCDSAVSFMKSHSLKFRIPEGSMSRALNEGRAKIKKMILPLIAAAGIKIFALAPILLGVLALLTFKALVYGKIALIVAGIMAFQKFFGGSGAGGFFNKNPAPLWYDNGATGSWASAGPSGLQHQGYRSFDVADAKNDAKNDAQDLAYSAHAPVYNGTD
ncbi:PREDICTED: uncharacterized protein LOC105569163 [Vollenhovia emeryi]|uniref:uncharacterized protein LOC105569163 n=1 Tax=Vollenhovia emeryi TaxID=411798 RepID=UPI0005F50EB7|nr:PREDICTED: uncharacterized protein LOC105569163 [Vollenhovia emeryi]